MNRKAANQLRLTLGLDLGLECVVLEVLSFESKSAFGSDFYQFAFRNTQS